VLSLISLQQDEFSDLSNVAVNSAESVDPSP